MPKVTKKQAFDVQWQASTMAKQTVKKVVQSPNMRELRAQMEDAAAAGEIYVRVDRKFSYEELSVLDFLGYMTISVPILGENTYYIYWLRYD